MMQSVCTGPNSAAILPVYEVEAASFNAADATVTRRLSYRLDVLLKDRARLSEAVEMADRIARRKTVRGPN